nr:uncharacterized mitochondrial protein AtMg00810-like [Tanacetum cinerariifolium]
MRDFFAGYSVVSKAMRVFNKRTRIAKETLNIIFLENAPNVKGNRPDWIFDIDSLIIPMNYESVVAGKQTNCHKDSVVDAGKKATEVDESRVSNNGGRMINSPVSTAGPSFANTASPLAINAAGTLASTNEFEEHPFKQFSPFKNSFSLLHVLIVTPINDIRIFSNAYDDEAVEEDVDINNVVSSYTIPDAPLTKFLKDNPKDHPKDQVIGSIETLVQIRQMTKINEEHDPDFPDKVYKVEKALYGLHQAPRACQEKYMADILKKFDFTTMKTASTPMKPNKALVKDAKAKDVDVHLYRSMIGSLMYLTASRHDITFAVCVCTRFQVTPKTSHLYIVKRIFRYLKGQPKLGLCYPRDSPFDLKAYSDSDYAGASLDKKSTTRCFQFLGKRLISWQCKKQTIVANSTTEAEYVAAANCCGQGTGSGSGLKCHDTILWGADAQTRRHLKLEESDGISTLPNTKIFEQLAFMGSQEDQPKDQLGVLSAAKILTDATRLHTYSKRRRAVNTGRGGVSTASRIISTAKETISTASVSMPFSIAGMVQESTSSPRATKEKAERHRMAQVHQAAQTFIEDEWENIRARVKADEELTYRLQAEESEKYSEDDRTKMLVNLINQRKKFFAQQKAEEIKILSEATMRRIQDFVPIEREGDKEVSKFTRTGVQEQPVEEEKELSQKDLQQLMIIGPEQGKNVEALQVKYLIIDWEIYTRVLKDHQKRFSSTEPNDDKDRVLWVELKRLFEHDADDELWKLQRYMHDLLKWRLYDTCGVHHMSTKREHDIFMLVEKDYPLTRGLMTVMLVNKL